MLKNVRNVLGLFSVISLVVIILAYLANREANAPHPDGNSTVLDMSSIYGSMSEFMQFIMPYAVGSLIISVAGVVLVTYRIKTY